MSEPIRLACVVEGPTDYVVILAAITSLISGREIIPRLLQPESSEAFRGIGDRMGLGWTGVYNWCRQAAAEGKGRVRENDLFSNYDLLIIHIDADVASMTYESGHIEEEIQDLPCERPCPPVSATTDALRRVVLRWLGESELPPYCVFCTPSKSTEAWVMAALFPHSKVMAKKGWECHPDPESQLGQQPKKKRIKKTRLDYENKRSELTDQWPALRPKLAEADRFSQDFLAQLPQHSE